MTYLQIIATLISVMLIFAAPMFMVFWKGALAGMMTMRLSREMGESRNRRLKKTNFICLGVMIICAIILGAFTSLDPWLFIFYVSCIPIVFVVAKNLKTGLEILSSKLVDSNWINLILVDLPLHYIFLFVYVRLMMQLIW